ncbi:DUF4352 domain-containing protein [Herbiconiux solani]|uniref:DUF4352 domain-containing protein n=1 Tax=Herbiconiux solani TaxID=661329 RepID=UPI0008271AEF|nr:DUF4352 domain-containing protein [Herbiconiux solani]
MQANYPAGPIANQPPYYPEGQVPPQAPPPQGGRNVIALIALIVSAIGFIFACIPGALIIGWILLPIAFVLSLVSLFLKGRGKGLGIAALIISIVGTIVGFVVFFAVVATSFNDAFDGGSEISITEPTQAGQAPVEEAPAEQAPADEAGTRTNPIPIGTALSNDDWTVVINSYNADGNATVASANQFNDVAPAGSHYEIVNYTVTYTGADSSYASEVFVDVVTSSGNVIDSYTSLVSLPDSIGLDELFSGASATGSAAFAVPDGESVLLRVQPGILADDIFVKP